MIAALVFLAVSLAALAWQSIALARLIRRSPGGGAMRLTHRGLLRTARCRVGAAALYVGLATVLLFTSTSPYLALIVFAFVQGLWMWNAWLDVRLRRKLTAWRADLSPSVSIPTPARNAWRRCPQVHTCELPRKGARRGLGRFPLTLGDQWGCDCGQWWQLRDFTFSADGDPTLQWERIH